jgi:hypothetical protein
VQYLQNAVEQRHEHSGVTGLLYTMYNATIRSVK